MMAKKVLITGKNSYIGNSFKKYMQSFSEEYKTETISLRNPDWKKINLSIYDSIFHVAGLAHADVSNVTDEIKKSYYEVNRDLTIEIAKKYKSDLNGKKGQFIFMSSIIVYGEKISLNESRIITEETKPNPSNFYGDSKLQAEKGLIPLSDKSFKVAIVRPPMIYGPNSKGNYAQLEKLALKLPIFPNVANERSMLAIGKLNECIKDTIDTNKQGFLFPQDDEYVRTSSMVMDIANENKKNIILFSFMNWFIKLLGFIPGRVGKLTNKAFGNLTYDKKMKNINFKESGRNR